MLKLMHGEWHHMSRKDLLKSPGSVGEGGVAVYSYTSDINNWLSQDTLSNSILVQSGRDVFDDFGDVLQMLIHALLLLDKYIERSTVA